MKTWQGESVIYATDKYDGWGCVIHKNEIGQVTLYTNKRTWFPNENKWWANIVRHVPNDTRLHVEIFVEGGVATDVISCLTKGKPLSMRVTGVQTWGGVDMCLADLESIEILCVSCGLQFTRWSKWLLHVNYSDLAIHRKIEGFVLKSHSYVPDRMYKVKPVLTMELAISGFIDGLGKYLGLVGAIVCEDATGKEVCKVSGFSDMIRVDLCHGDIGRIIEVSYQTITNSGKLRHPRFKRFRDDKKVAGVVWCE